MDAPLISSPTPSRRHSALLTPALLCLFSPRQDLDGKEIGQCSGYKFKELEELADGSLLSVGGKEVEVGSLVAACVALDKQYASQFMDN